MRIKDKKLLKQVLRKIPRNHSRQKQVKNNWQRSPFECSILLLGLINLYLNLSCISIIYRPPPLFSLTHNTCTHAFLSFLFWPTYICNFKKFDS